eukprot:NODE_173_length_14219_cov_0.603824.p1 type:complete len:832 gc:universal NODE_173_length_14219_cov_0.603824:2700-205(-)
MNHQTYNQQYPPNQQRPPLRPLQSPIQNNFNRPPTHQAQQQYPQGPLRSNPVNTNQVVGRPGRPNTMPPQFLNARPVQQIQRPVEMQNNQPAIQNGPPSQRPQIPQFNQPPMQNRPNNQRPQTPQFIQPPMQNGPNIQRPQIPQFQQNQQISPTSPNQLQSTGFASQFSQKAQPSNRISQNSQQYNQQTQPQVFSPESDYPSDIAIQSGDIQLSSTVANIPMVLYIQPLNSKFTQSYAIIRCRRCRTYLNCFCIIRANRWQCNTCNLFNNLETTDPNVLKPIMSSNSVEYFAPQEYMIRPPMSTCFYFVTDDINYLYEISQILGQIPTSQNRAMIGFILILEDIILITKDEIVIYNDVEDALILPRDQILMRIHEVNIAPVLDQIRQIYPEPRVKTHSLNSVFDFMLNVLKPIGGTITYLFQNDCTIKNPKNISLEASRCHVGVDGFCNANNELHYLSKYTGGNIFPYYPLTDVSRQQFHYYFTRTIGLEAVLRVRASSGLKAVQYFGQFFTRSSDLLALANVHPQNTYLVEFQIEEPVEKECVFQCALLHTSDQGDRRIRVLTCRVPVTTIPQALSSIDPSIIIAWLSRKAIDRSRETNVEDAKDAVLHKCIELMQLAKQNNLLPGQQLPPNFTQLLSFALGLCKTPMLRGEKCIIPNIEAICSMNLDSLRLALRPCVLNVNNILGKDLSGIFSAVMQPTTASLTHDGIFLVLTPFEWFIWISRDANTLNIFEIPYDQLSSGMLVIDYEFKDRKYNNTNKDIPILNYRLDSQFINVLKILYTWHIEMNCLCPPIFIVKETGHPGLRQRALWSFVDDKSPITITKEKSTKY